MPPLRGERFTRVIVKRYRIVVGNKGDLLTGHKALNGRFLSEARHNALEAVGVETAARHVFAAGIIAALNHENVKPFLGKNVGGPRSRLRPAPTTMASNFSSDMVDTARTDAVWQQLRQC